MTNSQSIRNSIIRSYLQCWKDLALTDCVYKIIAFLLLAPLVGVLFRILVAFSGRTFLADADILHFFLGPIGWLCAITIGALSMTILALEQTALLGILSASQRQRRLGALGALRFAAVHSMASLRITARMLTVALLTIAPLVVAAGLVYATLLTEHDINFFLTAKPPQFLLAVALGAVILVLLVAVLLRLATSWFFALPLVVFEKVPPRNALVASRQRATGHRTHLLYWIAAWLIATSLITAVAIGVVGFLGHLVVPQVTESLWLLLLVVGGLVLLWTGVNVAGNLLSSTLFATILFHLYEQLGSAGKGDVTELALEGHAITPAWIRLTRARLIIGTVLGIVVAAAAGAVALRGVRIDDHTEITAHRGASASAPENTLAAVLQAIEDGADWVEIDVQETADGQVVLIHDSDFKKLAGNPLKIWDATMDDLKNIDIGSWFEPEFHDQRVPTLGAVLDACQDKARVLIELKYYGHDQQLEQRVVDLVEAHGMEADVKFMSLKNDGIRKIKALRPGWTVGLLTAVKIGDLTRSDADFLAVSADLASRSLIKAAHKSGKEVHVWTVNDALSISTLMGRGVDNIITDRPALAKQVLKRRSSLSVTDRLLLDLAGLFGVQPEIGEP